MYSACKTFQKSFYRNTIFQFENLTYDFQFNVGFKISGNIKLGKMNYIALRPNPLERMCSSVLFTAAGAEEG